MKIDLTDNVLHPFMIDHSRIRGRLVRMNEAVSIILNQHAYPASVSQLLGEMLVVGALLASNLKNQGILTLQAKGAGPVKFIVVDADHKGALRGYAQLNDDASEPLPKWRSSQKAPALSRMLGKGYLALTLDQGKNGRYQGIVDLGAHSIAEGVREYFTQSQQVQVAFKLSVKRKTSTKKKAPEWLAGGMMIERMPEEGGIDFNQSGAVASSKRLSKKPAAIDDLEQWRRTQLFMETLTERELHATDLTGWTILERLFNEDGVWAYAPRPVKSECRCSRKKVAKALSTIAKDELKSMASDGEISVNCQFCNRSQIFTIAQIDRL